MSSIQQKRSSCLSPAAWGELVGTALLILLIYLIRWQPAFLGDYLTVAKVFASLGAVALILMGAALLRARALDGP